MLALNELNIQALMQKLTLSKLESQTSPHLFEVEKYF